MIIGVDVSCLYGGRGPARYTTELLQALGPFAREGDRFYLYSPFKGSVNGLGENFIQRYLPPRPGRPWLNLTLPMAARRDRVEVMFFPANDLWLWRVAPTVVSVLDMARQSVLYGQLPSWRDRMQVRMQTWALKRVPKRIITISNHSAGEISRLAGVDPARISVLYCGLSHTFRNAASAEPASPPYILFVGGFDRRKNLEGLLKAYRLLREMGRDERLVLAGSGGANRLLYYDMPALVSSMGLNNSVEVREGPSDAELAVLYRGASLFVMPSTIEGFGLPILEAMASGCPVVSSSAASLPEVGGEAALYFDAMDVKEMASVMEKVLSDRLLADELRARGREQAMSFSWEKAARETYDILLAAASN